MDKSETLAFREALGAFATGVTIVTAMNEQGKPVGVTATSFNSVSLDPPLVLWSLARNSHSASAFLRAEHFAVHVLSEDQRALAEAFARSGGEKFAQVKWRPSDLLSASPNASPSASGAPLLEGSAARFECRLKHQYDGGDHVILVGEVVEFEMCERAPLLFHRGDFARCAARD